MRTRRYFQPSLFLLRDKARTDASEASEAPGGVRAGRAKLSKATPLCGGCLIGLFNVIALGCASTETPPDVNYYRSNAAAVFGNAPQTGRILANGENSSGTDAGPIGRQATADITPNAPAGVPMTAAAATPQQGSNSQADPQTLDTSRKWMLVLQSFPAEQQARAQQVARTVAMRHGVPARVQPRRNAVVITAGTFDSLDDPDAQSLLARVKDISENGARPFAMALMVPVEEATSNNPNDLANARELHGDEAQYSLTVMVFERTDQVPPSPEELRSLQNAAERAAATLRADGETAFFFHGEQRSYVTVGLFQDRDFDPRNPAVQSLRLQQAKNDYKYLTRDGEIVTRPQRTSSGRLEPRPVASQLVRVP